MVDHTERLLKNAHTRVLLKWLRSARACGGSFSPCEESPGTFLSIEALKAELATREHIPNKAESRAIRQAAAKRGR
jgi:hypothetical protein